MYHSNAYVPTMCSVAASTLYHSEGNGALPPGCKRDRAPVPPCGGTTKSRRLLFTSLLLVLQRSNLYIELVIKLKIVSVLMAKCADELSPRFLLDRMMPVPTPYKITSRRGQCCVSEGILDEDNLATQGKQISSVQSADPTPYAYPCTCLRRTWMSILMSHLALSLSLIITWGYKWYLCGHNSIYPLSLITITASS